MYSKQHFENLAQFVKNCPINQKDVLAYEFVKLFSLDNSKFKTGKFLKACGFIQPEGNILKNTKNTVKPIYSVLACVNLNLRRKSHDNY